MPDDFTIDVDATAVIAALTTLGDAAQPYVNEASHRTADAIVRDARARLQRKLSGTSTGATLAGIEDRVAFDGNGYVVVSGRAEQPDLPLWLEKGTKKGKAGSHASPALAYFYSACQLEEAPHLQRIREALAAAIAEQGLGD